MPWLESVGINQNTANKYMKAAKVAGDDKFLQHTNLTIADLLGEEKKTRDKAKPKEEEKVKTISWATLAIECGVMKASAGGDQKKLIQKRLMSIEPSLVFPSRGFDPEGAVKFRATCERMKIEDGVEQEKPEPESERAKKKMDLAIEVEVQQRTKEAVQIALDDYNAVAKKQKAVIKAYSGIFTPKEYKSIVSALHSDNYQNLDDVQRGRIDRAFSLMRDKKFELCGEDNSNDMSTLPKTVQELYAMRNKKA